MNEKAIKLFVPGRLCIMGEHSDWAGINRMMNSEIAPGYAIVTGIEQGIYALAEIDENFIIESELPCFNGERYECKMDTVRLRKTAGDGGFFSYVAGVASYVNEHYRVKGLHIRITAMDLPIKSGLSSSAAICVLVARAFNRLYHLNLNTMGEMNIAYMGEQRTPSRCGRLDQACAYGVNPVCMKFDGNDISVRQLTVKTDLHFVVADLNAGKDTIKILRDLNRCYPFAKDDIEKKVQLALGEENKTYIEEAVKYIESGDVKRLGRLMTNYQRNFDKRIAPACPDELTAPVLHSVLNDKGLQRYIYGAKGVGSGGDGTVQFLAKDSGTQKELIAYLKEKRGMHAVSFILRPQQKIKRAIIPVAGFGTRLFPATKGLKKSFFPIMDIDDVLKPAILIMLEQLDQAGIEEICLVIGEDEEGTYDEFFEPISKEHYDRLPDDRKKYEDLIERLGRKVSYIVQHERKGFGHAVYLCRDFAGDEPVLLLLGDMIYRSYTEENCMSQMIRIYEKYGLPVISMHKVEKRDVVHYGIMHGKWEDEEETVMKLSEICEKPSVQYAEDYLNVANKQNIESYYAVFGQYILTSDVFDALMENVEKNNSGDEEIQLTDSLETVRSRIGVIGYKVSGKSYDIGLPDKYYETMTEFAKL